VTGHYFLFCGTGHCFCFVILALTFVLLLVITHVLLYTGNYFCFVTGHYFCFVTKESRVTLHVGAGTFRPITVANAADHTMHEEQFSVTVKTVQGIMPSICF
jgi:hypothetical protein